MSTPKQEKNWKGSMTRLFTCGSGKKGKKEDPKNAPTLKSENKYSLDDTDGEIDREVKTTKATRGHGSTEEEDISYTDLKVIGKGTFGVVYRARLVETGDLVAIKKVFHDERYKNRELQMMMRLDHPNILLLRYYFYSRGERYKSNELYLNMVMDFLPETLYSVAKCDGTKKPLLEILYVKVYLYQVLRSLAYLHSLGICHRDIKPQNLLLNPETSVIKLCDFGSAKELLKGEANIAYICSRYYRAPELVLGTTNYTSQIDVWSTGCVLGELLLGQPIFPGANGPDQLVEIIKVLGTPSVDDIYEISPLYTDFRFPQLLPHPWNKVIKTPTDPDALDLLTNLLMFAPSRRLVPIEALVHNFFDELRNPRTRLPNGKGLPPLFDFTKEELEICPEFNDRLVPADHITDHDDFNPDSFASGQPTQVSSPVHHGLLGQIGGSFRNSLKGIKKIPSSSGKKKKKKGSSSGGIEDTTDMSGVDAELMTSIDVSHVEHAPWNESERNVNDDEHFEPGEVLEVAIHSQKLGIREQSTPTHYQQYLDEVDDEVPSSPKMENLEIEPLRNGGGGKKKKKSSKPKARTASDVEQSVEASMMSSYMESDGMSDLGLEATQAAAPAKTKPRKSKKQISSTPTNDAISLEGSPISSPPPPTSARPTTKVTVEVDDDLPPPPAVDVQEVKVVKKKRPKVAKKPTTGGSGNRNNTSGGRNSSQDGLEEEF